MPYRGWINSLFLAVLVVVFVGPFVKRFLSESSPIARGAAHAATHRCADKLCRAELSGKENGCDDLAEHIMCSDVEAYWYALRLKHDLPGRLEMAPDNRLLQGERLARERNCFRCHGELGQGGFANAGSFKGYVPGYFGHDFKILTNGAEKDVVREWITSGSSKSLTNHPLTGRVARHFLEQQAVSMPRFESLPADEIDLLVDYVVALSRFGALDVDGLVLYERSTMSQLAASQLTNM